MLFLRLNRVRPRAPRGVRTVGPPVDVAAPRASCAPRRAHSGPLAQPGAVGDQKQGPNAAARRGRAAALGVVERASGLERGVLERLLDAFWQVPALAANPPAPTS